MRRRSVGPFKPMLSLNLKKALSGVKKGNEIIVLTRLLEEQLK